MSIEATVQFHNGEMIPCNFLTLPRIGEDVKLATKQKGPIQVEEYGTVRNIIHLIVPKLHSETHNEIGNYHIINIVA